MVYGCYQKEHDKYLEGSVIAAENERGARITQDASKFKKVNI